MLGFIAGVFAAGWFTRLLLRYFLPLVVIVSLFGIASWAFSERPASDAAIATEMSDHLHLPDPDPSFDAVLAAWHDADEVEVVVTRVDASSPEETYLVRQPGTASCTATVERGNAGEATFDAERPAELTSASGAVEIEPLELAPFGIPSGPCELLPDLARAGTLDGHTVQLNIDRFTDTAAARDLGRYGVNTGYRSKVAGEVEQVHQTYLTNYELGRLGTARSYTVEQDPSGAIVRLVEADAGGSALDVRFTYRP